MLREQESRNKVIRDNLDEKEQVLEHLKRENARILQEKNVDIARLESGNTTTARFISSIT